MYCLVSDSTGQTAEENSETVNMHLLSWLDSDRLFAAGAPLPRACNEQKKLSSGLDMFSKFIMKVTWTLVALSRGELEDKDAHRSATNRRMYVVYCSSQLLGLSAKYS